jgi:hypothetical protein
VLHPSFKKQYFTKAKWPVEWIAEAERLIKKEWEANYRPQADEVAESRRNGSALGGGKGDVSKHLSLLFYF